MAKEDQLPREEPKGPTTGMLHRKPSKTCPLCPVWGIPWDPMNPETFDKQHIYAERLWHEWEPGDKSGRWIGRVIEAAAEMGIEVTPEQVKEHFSDRHKIEQPMMSGTLNHDRALYQAHQFSDRAQAVVNAVYRQHVLTTKQIADVFYRPGRSANAARQAALVELSQLAQGHFLYRYYPSEADKSRRNTPPQFGKSVMFFLGRAAIPYIKERYDLNFQPSYLKRARDVKTETLLHDLKANSVFSSICEALTVRGGEVEVLGADEASEKMIVEAKPENWYGPGPQALTMAFVDPYEGVERRIMPDGFASLSVHRATSISPTQLPFFYEFDNGTRENQDVAEQMIAYHLLTLSRSALKRFPDLDVEGYAIPMLMVFSDRKRMERIAKRFREHAASLGLTNGAPILLASESDWNGDPFASGLVRSAWHEDQEPQAFMKLLVAASKPLTDSQLLTPDAILRLDPKAASPTPGQTHAKKPSSSAGAGAAQDTAGAAIAPPAPAPPDQPWIATPSLPTPPASPPIPPAPDPWGAQAEEAQAPEAPVAEPPAPALTPIEEHTPADEVEDAADLARLIIATRAYLADLETRHARALNPEVTEAPEPPVADPVVEPVSPGADQLDPFAAAPPSIAPQAPPVAVAPEPRAPEPTTAEPMPPVVPPAPVIAPVPPAAGPATEPPAPEPPAPAQPMPPMAEQPVPAVPEQTALPPAAPAPVAARPTVDHEPASPADAPQTIAMPSVPAALPPEEPAPEPVQSAQVETITSTPAPLPVEEPSPPEPTSQTQTGFPDLESEFGAPTTDHAEAPEEFEDVPLIPSAIVPPVEPEPVEVDDPLAPTGLDDIEDGPDLIDLPDVLDGYHHPALPADSPVVGEAPYVVGPDGTVPAAPVPPPAPTPAPAAPAPTPVAPPATAPQPPPVPSTPGPTPPPPEAPVTHPAAPDPSEEDDDMPSLHPTAPAQTVTRPQASDFARPVVDGAEDAQLEEPRREIEQWIAESAAARRKRRRKRGS